MGTPEQIWPDRPAPERPGGWPAGWHVHHVHETGSTNADLLAVADRAPDRTVLTTDHQTAGRGRLDRRWEAPPGENLLVSLLFRDVPADAGELTRRVGLAAAAAAQRTVGADVRLKWPNDLLLDGRKLAGILAQHGGSGHGGSGPIVVGLGLNVGWAPPGAARLRDHPGRSVSPVEVLAALLVEYDALPADVTAAYRDRLDTLGRRVRVERPDGEITGRALDVERGGRLIVLDDCGITHRLDVGDVVHLRDADTAGPARPGSGPDGPDGAGSGADPPV